MRKHRAREADLEPLCHTEHRGRTSGRAGVPAAVPRDPARAAGTILSSDRGERGLLNTGARWGPTAGPNPKGPDPPPGVNPRPPIPPALDCSTAPAAEREGSGGSGAALCRDPAARHGTVQPRRADALRQRRGGIGERVPATGVYFPLLRCSLPTRRRGAVVRSAGRLWSGGAVRGTVPTALAGPGPL